MMASEDPAPTRRELRQQDRRRAMIAAARASFLDRGYAATSMSALAATLGGSKATLWSYFPSKEALFAAVLDEATAAFRADLASCLVPAGPLEETLRRFARRFLTILASPDGTGLWRLVVAESGRFPEVGRLFFDHVVRGTQAPLAAFLARHMERGDLRAGDPERTARTLSALCTGRQNQMLWGVYTPDAGSIAVEADDAVAVFLRAFACPHAPLQAEPAAMTEGTA